MSEPTEPRQNVREILHQTLNPHSVELTVTAAGAIAGSVKVYDENPLRAFQRAAEILDKVRERYPRFPTKATP